MSDSYQLQLVLTTCANIEQARTMATQLVEQKLAACVNIIPSVESVYRWQEQIQHDNESKLLIKTTTQKVPPLVDAINALHSYDVPDIQVIAATAQNQAYIDWLNEVLN